MPRPMKFRRICSQPQIHSFGPIEVTNKEQLQIQLQMDEYETLRLIDYEGNTQDECATQMQVARTTVQKIYGDARKKVAEALIFGKVIVISGGEVQLADHQGKSCGKGCRHQGKHRRRANSPKMEVTE